jgi:hypothetical protein
MTLKKAIRTIVGMMIWVSLCVGLQAQSLLNNTVSIHAIKQPLGDVLTIISNASNVTFSYNTKVINRDSLVTVHAVNKPLSEVLRMIFNAAYEFKESGSYIIIRRRPVSTSTVRTHSGTVQDFYWIQGRVVDEENGEPLSDVTVYEKKQLISALTDQKGRFAMKLKSKYPVAALSVSKSGYADTSLELKAKQHQEVSIALQKEYVPALVMVADTGMATQSAEPILVQEEQPAEDVERKWITNIFVSTKQKIQSLNLKKFYTTKVYQISLLPSIGTHGRMNAQVTNQVSINLLGGYSGGTDGFEVGTLFNMTKRHMRGVQVAGLFNLVGGKVKGTQVSCLYNESGDTVKGVQISGLVNVAKKVVKGMQIASLVNAAASVHGVQIGLINITGSREGSSIGLINISKGRKTRVGFVLRLPRKERV